MRKPEARSARPRSASAGKARAAAPSKRSKASLSKGSTPKGSTPKGSTPRPSVAGAVKVATRSIASKATGRSTTVKSPRSPSPRPKRGGFPIVGLGASAGGLEALETFLANVPPKSGMAYVVVQHLDPTHKGMLPELLQRATKMPVAEITDRTVVLPDRVFVIPPNKDLSILDGVLHLLRPVAPRGLRLPIDFFLRSLADDQGERSVAVILSGMGSDGTFGIRAIKEKAGAVFVQSPATAKFDGMPRNAIDSGLADVVASPEELAPRIVAFHHHLPTLPRPLLDPSDKEHGALDKIIILLRAQTGHDFAQYKKATVYRRVERRMGLHQLSRIADYVRYLRENPQEASLLFKELLIGVTSFFRDGAVWDQLRDETLPALFASRPKAQVFRAWSAGCSTGEEAYSLAMAFREAAERLDPPRNVTLQIFATDLDQDAIDRARHGTYPANIAADVSEARLARFFSHDDRGYRVSKQIREMVIFATHNLVMDPPFTKLDIVVCRNLLIYLDPELQQKVIPAFHYSLNPGGVLMLGSSETVGPVTDLFAALPGKTRLYQRLDQQPERRPRAELPAVFAGRAEAAPALREKARPVPSLQSVADRFILQHYAPAVVLTGEKGDILYTSGRTGKYLEPAAGQANWNIFAMARPGLGYALSEAFNKAARIQAPVTLHGAKVGTNGGMQTVDVTAQQLVEPEALRGLMLVLFSDTPVPGERPGRSERSGARGRWKELVQKLQQAHEELQSTREEMQASQEELQSANEELQSTNEELQSTNEELTTSKEEMQSMNEELQTVNHELSAKVDELSRANNDMKNLLNSTDIATLFLDDALNVRRFTSPITSIIKLIPGDAGRPITDLVTEMTYPDLAADAREVLRTLVPAERVVATHDGRWFTVRIMPYRTLENRIDGVVITFVDVSASKRLEAELRATEAKLREGMGKP